MKKLTIGISVFCSILFLIQVAKESNGNFPYYFGMFLFWATIPTIMWIVTYFVEKSKKD